MIFKNVGQNKSQEQSVITFEREEDFEPNKNSESSWIYSKIGCLLLYCNKCLHYLFTEQEHEALWESTSSIFT